MSGVIWPPGHGLGNRAELRRSRCCLGPVGEAGNLGLLGQLCRWKPWLQFPPVVTGECLKTISVQPGAAGLEQLLLSLAALWMTSPCAHLEACLSGREGPFRGTLAALPCRGSCGSRCSIHPFSCGCSCPAAGTAASPTPGCTPSEALSTRWGWMECGF